MLERLLIIGLLLLGGCACGWATPTPFAAAPLPPSATATLAPPPATATLTPLPSSISLAEQLGFSDAVIQELQAQHTECLITARSKIAQRPHHYIAYLITCTGTNATHLLVYAHQPRGMASVPPRRLLHFGGIVSLDCGVTQAENWRDVDGDQLPDLIFCGGNNYLYHTYVFRMTAAGELENLLDACPLYTQGPGIRGFSEVGDLDGDGDLEIVAMDTRWDYDPSDMGRYIPGIARVFTLQGCEYQDVSAVYPDRYAHTINVFLRNYNALGGTITQEGVFAAFDGLLACDAIGRRDKCWSRFWNMTDLAWHSFETVPRGLPPTPTPSAADLAFMAWVNAHRAVLQQQYVGALPFAPPAP